MHAIKIPNFLMEGVKYIFFSFKIEKKWQNITKNYT